MVHSLRFLDKSAKKNNLLKCLYRGFSSGTESKKSCTVFLGHKTVISVSLFSAVMLLLFL